MSEKAYILLGVIRYERWTPLLASSEKARVEKAMLEISDYLDRCRKVGERFRRDDPRYTEAVREVERKSPYSHRSLEMYDYFEISEVKSI